MFGKAIIAASAMAAVANAAAANDDYDEMSLNIRLLANHSATNATANTTTTAAPAAASPAAAPATSGATGAEVSFMTMSAVALATVALAKATN